MGRAGGEEGGWSDAGGLIYVFVCIHPSAHAFPTRLPGRDMVRDEARQAREGLEADAADRAVGRDALHACHSREAPLAARQQAGGLGEALVAAAARGPVHVGAVVLWGRVWCGYGCW